MRRFSTPVGAVSGCGCSRRCHGKPGPGPVWIHHLEMAAALESMAGSFMRHCGLARYVVRSLANSQGPLNEFAPVAMIKQMLFFLNPRAPIFSSWRFSAGPLSIRTKSSTRSRSSVCVEGTCWRSEKCFGSNRLPVKRPLSIEEVLIRRLSKSPGSCLAVRLFQPGEQKRDGLFQPT
jgi:hypothetical protein